MVHFIDKVQETMRLKTFNERLSQLGLEFIQYVFICFLFYARHWAA